MVLISIHPFALRKVFLVIVAFLCFSAFCFADPVLMVRRYASHPERFGAATTIAMPTRQELRERCAASVAAPGLDVFESIDISFDQIKVDFTKAGDMELARTAPSSIFRNVMCALRSTDRPRGTSDCPTPLLPDEI